MTPLFEIGIVGGGFAGTAMAAALHRLATSPIRVVLFEQSGQCGAGPAYSTPFSHHLLNVRAKEMSVFEDKPLHFAEWLKARTDLDDYCDVASPVESQFFPRALYRDYLQSVLQTMQQDTASPLTLEIDYREVVDVIPHHHQMIAVFSDGTQRIMDQIILAVGAPPPASFAFSAYPAMHVIHYPWDYAAQAEIPQDAAVLIVGTGLSMVDVVLTLYHRAHRGKIYAVSRRGLLPLSHLSQPPTYPLSELPAALIEAPNLRSLVRQFRTHCEVLTQQGGDWQVAIDALRLQIPAIWRRMTFAHRRQFMRHLLPYWNVHRHRVPASVLKVLNELIDQQQLVILRGQMVATQDGVSYIKSRPSQQMITIPTEWLVNCMGPGSCINNDQKTLLRSLLARNIATLDPLQLGLMTDPVGALMDQAGQVSTQCYAVGALTRGATWELTAVPRIRQQVFELARHLLCYSVQGKGKHGVKCYSPSF